MKYLYYTAILMAFFSCSSDNNDPELENMDPEPEVVNLLTLTEITSLANLPFSLPRESIVFNNNLYVLTGQSTFKYDFSSSSWEEINSVSNGIADLPSLDYNISFIRNNKWHVLNQYTLSAFDFSTNSWEMIFQFDNNNLTAPIGAFSDNELYLFSDIFDTIYKYNFNDNTLTVHANFEQKSNFGQLVKSVFNINGNYYFTKLTGYSKIAIYKWTDNFTKFEFLNEYESNYIAQGLGFVVDDNIVFGLGGEALVNTDGDVLDSQTNNKFYYYNTATDVFEIVENNFYENRYVALPVRYNDELYVLGGQAIVGNQIINRSNFDKLTFEFVEN